MGVCSGGGGGRCDSLSHTVETDKQVQSPSESNHHQHTINIIKAHKRKCLIIVAAGAVGTAAAIAAAASHQKVLNYWLLCVE